MAFKQEDFTEQAQQAIGTSYEIVRRYRHPQWDVEHVMIALLEAEDSVPVQLLKELRVDLDSVHVAIEHVLEETPKLAREATEIHPTPRAMTM